MGKKKITSAIILAAGNSSRMNLENGNSKIFMKILGKPCLFYSLKAFEKCSFVKEIIVVCKDEHRALVKNIIKNNKNKGFYKIVTGGKSRQESVFNGFKNVSDACEYLIIHDAARCLITEELINKLMVNVTENSCFCAVLGVPVKDTIKTVKAEKSGSFVVTSTEPRENLWQIQTPQVLKKDLYEHCIQMAISENKTFTDDSQLVEKYSKNKVNVILGDYSNIKLTTPEDIFVVESILAKINTNRIQNK